MNFNFSSFKGHNKETAFLMSCVEGHTPVFFYSRFNKEEFYKDLKKRVEEKINNKKKSNIFLITRGEFFFGECKGIYNKTKEAFVQLKEKYKEKSFVNFVDIIEKYNPELCESLYFEHVMKRTEEIYKNINRKKVNIIFMSIKEYFFLKKDFENVENTELFFDEIINDIILDEQYEGIFRLYYPMITDIEVLSNCFENFFSFEENIDSLSKGHTSELLNKVNLRDIYREPTSFILFKNFQEADSIFGFSLIPKEEGKIFSKKDYHLKKLYDFIVSQNVKSLVPYDKMYKNFDKNKKNYMDVLLKEILFYRNRKLSRRLFVEPKKKVLIELDFVMKNQHILDSIKKCEAVNILLKRNEKNSHSAGELNETLENVYYFAKFLFSNNYISIKDSIFFLNPINNLFIRVKE